MKNKITHKDKSRIGKNINKNMKKDKSKNSGSSKGHPKSEGVKSSHKNAQKANFSKHKTDRGGYKGISDLKKSLDLKKKSSSHEKANPHDSKKISGNYKGKKIDTQKFSPKKEIKIEVSSFKKEHMKKQELKKIKHEKDSEVRNQKAKTEFDLKKKNSKIEKSEKLEKSDKDKHDKQNHSEKQDKNLSKKWQTHGKGVSSSINKTEEASIDKNKKPETLKSSAKDKKPNKLVNKSKDEEMVDDVFLADESDGEIDEYADDLKAVEEIDIETEESIEFEIEVKEKNYEDINLRDAEGNLLCRARDCDQVANVDGYCRFHYLLYWKKIQIRKKILADGKLERYVDELTSRYPDKFLEMIRRDLRTQKDFLSAIQELEIDESSLENDFEEDAQTYIDEVRGMNESPNIDEEYE